MRLYIIGIVASGKSTLARGLAEYWGVPWHEVDEVVHNRSGNGVKRTAEEQRAVMEELGGAEHWVFEGTYRPSCSVLLELADVILFLDPPLWKRRVRILTRWIRQMLGRESCSYRPSLWMLCSMYRWTREFEKNRPGFTEMLAVHGHKLIHAQRYLTVEQAGELLLGKDLGSAVPAPIARDLQ